MSARRGLIAICAISVLLVGRDVGAETLIAAADRDVATVQLASVFGHAIGAGTGVLVGGAIIILRMRPILSKQRDTNFVDAVFLSLSTTVFGTLIGGLSTWGVGELMDAPGRLLPTMGVAAIGHALGGLTTFAWVKARRGDGVWIVPGIVGTLAGTTGAIVGYHLSF